MRERSLDDAGMWLPLPCPILRRAGSLTCASADVLLCGQALLPPALLDNYAYAAGLTAILHLSPMLVTGSAALSCCAASKRINKCFLQSFPNQIIKVSCFSMMIVLCLG